MVLLLLDVVGGAFAHGPANAAVAALLLALLPALAWWPRAVGLIVTLVYAMAFITPGDDVYLGFAALSALVVLTDWVATRRYILAVLGVLVQFAVVLVRPGLNGDYLQSALLVSALCVLVGEVIGRFQRRGDGLAREVELARVRTELAQQQLRVELSAQLHDSLATSLTEILIRCRAFRAGLTTQDADGVLRAVEEDTSSILAVLRNLVADLGQRDPRLDRTSLTMREALEECQGMLALRGIQLDADPEAAQDAVRAMDPECRTVVTLALREAAANALKYAPARSEATCALESTDGVLDFTFSSLMTAVDGAGARAGADRAMSGGMGISLLARRLERLGGTLEAWPAGGRWMVSGTVPVHRPAVVRALASTPSAVKGELDG